MSLKDSKTGVIKDSVSKLNLYKKSNQHWIIPLYLEYKKYKKITTSLSDKFLKHVNPMTGRIHSQYWQIQATGRISSSNPNLQNIPASNEFRNCFTLKGKYIITADYSSQEARVVADVAKEKTMIEFFNSSNNPDIHSFVASKMFSIPIEEVTPEIRNKGKKTNFTLLYGGGVHKLVDEFNISKKEAFEMIQFYFTAFPTLKKFFTKKYEETILNGYILIDNIIKRKYFLSPEVFFLMKLIYRYNSYKWEVPKILSTTLNRELSSIERKCSNYPIQGLSGTMTKLGGILFRRFLIERNLISSVEIINMVHDEIVVLCTDNHKDLIMNKLKECMEKAGKYLVKQVNIPVTIEINEHWKK